MIFIRHERQERASEDTSNVNICEDLFVIMRFLFGDRHCCIRPLSFVEANVYSTARLEVIAGFISSAR